MQLFRDLWVTSPHRTGVVAFLIVLGAGGQAAASAVAGGVLLNRSFALFGVLAVALVAAVVSDLAVGLIVAGLTADWAAQIRRRLCRIAFGQDLPTLETTPVGELLDRIDGDVNQVAAAMRGSGVRIIQSLAHGALAIVTATVVWWPAGIVMAVVAGLLAVGLGDRTRRIAGARMEEEQAWSNLAAVMEESIHAQDDVRTTLARPYVLKLYAERASQVLDRGRQVRRMSAQVTAIAAGVMRAGIAVVVLGGVWMLLTGRIDPARLTAIWLLAVGFGGAVEHVSRIVPELQHALGSWNRVQLLESARQEPVGGRSPADGDLAVRGLTFGYAADEPGRGPALRNVHLTFARGRSYALIGRTGSGKSTLAKVLTRAVDIPRGTVFLGETDLLDLDVEEVRRWIATVPQRTEILAGTLAENIALFDPDLLERAAWALDELGLTSWVADLPDGMRTRLGDGGHVLSAGQEQLVAFARILLRDPHVVILDEATARLDPVTEGRVQRATERLLRNRIGILIAHRLSSVQRCDEVVVLGGGSVLEAGPLRQSQRFARLLADGNAVAEPAGAIPAARTADADGAVAVGGPRVPGGEAVGGPRVPGGEAVPDPRVPGGRAGPDTGDAGMTMAPKTVPPSLPAPPSTRVLREIFRLITNDPRLGLGAIALFVLMIVLGLEGAVLPWLWADLVDGTGSLLWPAVGIVAGLLLALPFPYYAGIWYAEWWVRQMLRIGLRLVHGQTGPRRISAHSPAEVVAQGGDTDRVVSLADNVVDHFIGLLVMVSMTVVSGTVVPALFFAATMVVSGLAATLFGPVLQRSADRTVATRAAFATALVSSLSAARTVKLAAATRSVLAHLARLDLVRNNRQRQEIAAQVWARSTPTVVSGLLPLGAWALYLFGGLPAAATLVTVSTLGAARWFAWTSASLISQLPPARVWTERTVAMAGVGAYSSAVPGVDLAAGTAPAQPAAPRHPLRRLELAKFSAVHEDGTVGVRDIDLTVERGQSVLITGPVGSGKSSLLQALAGIVHHTGVLRWNDRTVTEPELFLRPNQVGYVSQFPRVLSGTIADNVRLGHEVDVAGAISTAQLDHDLASAGGGLRLLVGHKGVRLSGGQLQRLALARALAPKTELLVADDVSSALDVTTELNLWRALRELGVTVVGATSKRAALAQADQVVVLMAGRAVAQGTWRELEARWGHLAG